MSDTADRAIRAALQGRWDEAAELNLTMLKQSPSDIAALNRLGKAYTELNERQKAREIYGRVLKLDKFNPIARKNLQLLRAREKHPGANAFQTTPPIRADFLEEPGKTKTTQLVRLAAAEIISSLHVGQAVVLNIKGRTVSVELIDGTYIGSLPDDLSFRLGRFIRAGNKYEALIKSLPGAHGVQIFIREKERSQKLMNTPSFPASGTTQYHADLRTPFLIETPIDTSQTGEEEEP